MKRKYLAALLFLAIVALGLWVVGLSPEAEEEHTDVIKMGAILPLTEDLAFVGEQLRRGIEIGLSEYQDLGIEVVYEDGRLDSTLSLSALQKLIEVDEVSVVLNSVTNTMKALAPVLNRKEVPGIVIYDSGEALSEQGEYVFGLGFNVEENGARMARFAREELGVSRASVVSVNDEWSEVISESFIKEFRKLGGQIETRERVNLSESDLRLIISKIISKDSEAVYMPLFLQPLNSMVRQSSELGYDGYLLAADGLFDVDAKNLGELASGIYLTQLWLEDQSFLEKYKQRYTEEDPVNLSMAGLGYDGVKLVGELIRSMKRSGIEITPQNIKENIVGFNFDGVHGATRIGDDHLSNKIMSILRVEDGGFVLVPIQQ